MIEEFRVKKQRIEESLLTNATDAASKADVLIQDIHTVRPIVTLRLDVADYPSPRIFDIVDATVSLIKYGTTREYYGSLRGQVIGIRWMTDTNEIEIDLREKEELV